MKSEETGQRKMTKEDYQGMYSFVCECGVSMAINGQLLDRALFSGRYIKCPNRLYQKCNKSYSAKYFKDNSLFIPPQNFQNQ